MQSTRFGAAFCWHPLSGIGVVDPQASSSGERTRSTPHASCGRTPHSDCSNVTTASDAGTRTTRLFGVRFVFIIGLCFPCVLACVGVATLDQNSPAFAFCVLIAFWSGVADPSRMEVAF